MFLNNTNTTKNLRKCIKLLKMQPIAWLLDKYSGNSESSFRYFLDKTRNEVNRFRTYKMPWANYVRWGAFLPSKEWLLHMCHKPPYLLIPSTLKRPTDMWWKYALCYVTVLSNAWLRKVPDVNARKKALSSVRIALLRCERLSVMADFTAENNR